MRECPPQTTSPASQQAATTMGGEGSKRLLAKNLVPDLLRHRVYPAVAKSPASSAPSSAPSSPSISCLPLFFPRGPPEGPATAPNAAEAVMAVASASIVLPITRIPSAISPICFSNASRRAESVPPWANSFLLVSNSFVLLAFTT